ncbi:hypothetical protein CPB85DRAFT_1313069 [Mucidula mucida]|nr:hypothetical protein CPB85DRAFT_1313069 [Mucidula mucida]
MNASRTDDLCAPKLEYIPGVNLELLTGPLILGYMWSYCLYGMLIVQVYLYSEKFPNDRKALKLTVWSLFLLETVFTIFMTIGAWNAYGPWWGDLDSILIIDWSWEPLSPLSGIMAGMAQTFYAWRIYCLAQIIWVPLIIVLIMLVQVTVVFHFDILFFIRGAGVFDLFKLSNETTIWLVGSAACDIIITISLVAILIRRKPTSPGVLGVYSTANLINKLVRFNVETGMITSLGAITELTVFLTSHEYNIHFIFFLMLGKLYSNTLMATLNYRGSLEKQNDMIVIAQSSFWADVEHDALRSIQFGQRLRPLVETRITEMAADDRDLALENFAESSVDGRQRPAETNY